MISNASPARPGRLLGDRPWTAVALLLLAAVLGPDVSAVAQADELQQNWSRFRGHNGSGQGGGLEFPAQWTDDDYLWKVDLPGKGHGSPTGWNRRVFVTAGDPDTGAATMLCFDAASGDALWSRTFDGARHKLHAGNSYGSATPAADAQRVYAAFSGRQEVNIVALTHDGQLLWSQRLGEFHGNHGFAASPVVVGDVVCLQVDNVEQGALVGLQADDGAVIWRAPRPAGKASYASPVLIETVQDGQSRRAVISTSLTGGMQAVGLDSGEVIWDFGAIFPERCVGSPTVAGDLVVAACGSGGGGKTMVAVDVRADGGQGAVKWQFSKNLPYVPTPLVDRQGRRLFTCQDRGVVSWYDLTTGETLWKKRIGGNYYSSPILAGGKIYCLSRAGEAVVLAAADKYRLLGRSELGEATHATPAIHQGRMYLRTESTLACLPPVSRVAAE